MNKKFISLMTILSITLTPISPALAKTFDSRENVDLTHKWTVNFNQRVNVNEAFEDVYVTDSKGNKISTDISFNDDHTKMIISPKDEYAPNTTYTLNIGGVSNEEGKVLSDRAVLQFTTSNAAPSGKFDISNVYVNTEGNTANTNVEPNSSFNIELNKAVDTSTLSNITVTDKDGNKANIKAEASGNQISILPNNTFWDDDTAAIGLPRNAFKCNTSYTISFNGVKSTDGQDISTKSYSFTTRDYKLNPTIQGICNDDYIKFVDQYASELFNPVDPITEETANGLCKAHDNNGTIVFDRPNGALPSTVVYQVNNLWNSYANIQARNQYDLAVEFRKQYNKMVSKDSSCSGRMVVLSGDSFSKNDTWFGLTANANEDMFEDLFSIDIYSSTDLDKESLNIDTYDSYNPGELNKIFTTQHPQIKIALGPNMNDDVEGTLQRLYLYEELCSLFGFDYANEIYDYMITNQNSEDSSKQVTKQVKIGNITLWTKNEIFLFKY